VVTTKALDSTRTVFFSGSRAGSFADNSLARRYAGESAAGLDGTGDFEEQPENTRVNAATAIIHFFMKHSFKDGKNA
jgi:hypothetical protein